MVQVEMNGIYYCSDKDGGGYNGEFHQFDNSLFQNYEEQQINVVRKTFRNSANSEPEVEYEYRNSGQNVPNTFRNSEETAFKRIRLSSELNSQEGDGKSNEEKCSPLGLTLSKTPSFMNLVEMKLSQSRQKTTTNYATKNQDYTSNLDDFRSQQPSNEKLKASNFCASLLKIGSWERISRHEGDLVAKCYYAKRKFVWEILEGALKSKIEIQWSDIAGIRATISENEPGILEIELNQPPSFFREINPQPRKHTLWQQAEDFTGGQAPLCRRHSAIFPPGILDKNYEKLLQSDQRLFVLSQKPFPCEKSPYFHPNTYAPTQFSFDFNGFGPEFSPRHEVPVSNFLIPVLAPYHVLNFNNATRSPLTIMDSNKMSVMDDSGNNNSFLNQRISCQGLNNVGDKFVVGDHIQANNVLPCPDYCIMNHGDEIPSPNSDPGILGDINEIEKHLLGDPQILWYDDTSVNIPHLEANSNNCTGVNIRHLEVNPSNNYNDMNIQHLISNGGLAYVKPVSRFPPPDSHENKMMTMQKNDSYPYAFSELAVEDFANLNNTQHLISNGGLAYVKPVSRFPPPDSHENKMMNMQKNDSYSYAFSELAVEDFANLNNTQVIQHWN